MLPLSCLCSEDSKSNSSIRLPLTTATRVSSGWRASISMRMDIENSPGAPCKRAGPAPRDENDHAPRLGTAAGGTICGYCCFTGHPAKAHGKHARLLGCERTKGVLWRHVASTLRAACLAWAAARNQPDEPAVS